MITRQKMRRLPRRGSIYKDHTVDNLGSHERARNSAHRGKRSVLQLMLVVATVVVIVVGGAAVVGSLAKKSSQQQQTQLSSSSTLNTTSGCNALARSPRNGHDDRQDGEHHEPQSKTSRCIDSGGRGDLGDHHDVFQNRTGNETGDGGENKYYGNHANFHNASDSQD